jgi:hypothetical protein
LDESTLGRQFSLRWITLGAFFIICQHNLLPTLAPGGIAVAKSGKSRGRKRNQGWFSGFRLHQSVLTEAPVGLGVASEKL